MLYGSINNNYYNNNNNNNRNNYFFKKISMIIFSIGSSCNKNCLVNN